MSIAVSLLSACPASEAGTPSGDRDGGSPDPTVEPAAGGAGRQGDATQGAVAEAGTIRLEVDGELLVMPAYSHVMFDAAMLSGLVETPFANVLLVFPNELGTHACSDPHTPPAVGTSVQISRTDADLAAGGDRGTCTVDVDEIATARGESWVGTFSAELVASGDVRATVMRGSFNVVRTGDDGGDT